MKKFEESKEEHAVPADKTFINANEVGGAAQQSVKVISCVTESSTRKLKVSSFSGLEQYYQDGYFFYVDADGDVVEQTEDSWDEYITEHKGRSQVQYYFHPKLELRDNIAPEVHRELCQRFKQQNVHTNSAAPQTQSSAPLHQDVIRNSGGGTYPNQRSHHQNNSTQYSQHQQQYQQQSNMSDHSSGVASALHNLNTPVAQHGLEIAGAGRSAIGALDSMQSLVQLGLLDRMIFERVQSEMIDGLERARPGCEILQRVVALCQSNAGQLDAATVAIADRFCDSVGPSMDMWLQRSAKIVQPSTPSSHAEQRAVSLLKGLRQIYRDPRIASRAHGVATRIIQQAQPCQKGLMSGNVDMSLRSQGMLVRNTIAEVASEPQVLALLLEVLPVLRDNHALDDPSQWITSLLAQGTNLQQRVTNQIRTAIDQGLRVVGARGTSGLNTALQTASSVLSMLANPDTVGSNEQWNNQTSQGREYGSNLVSSFLTGLQQGLHGGEVSMNNPTANPTNNRRNNNNNRNRNNRNNNRNNNNNNNNQNTQNNDQKPSTKGDIHMLD